jgi:hypothetical protein
MKQANINRLKKAAELLDKAVDLLDYVTEREELQPKDAYFFTLCRREIISDLNGIKRIAKVAQEDLDLEHQ